MEADTRDRSGPRGRRPRPACRRPDSRPPRADDGRGAGGDRLGRGALGALGLRRSEGDARPDPPGRPRPRLPGRAAARDAGAAGAAKADSPHSRGPRLLDRPALPAGRCRLRPLVPDRPARAAREAGKSRVDRDDRRALEGRSRAGENAGDPGRDRLCARAGSRRLHARRRDRDAHAPRLAPPVAPASSTPPSARSRSPERNLGQGDLFVFTVGSTEQGFQRAIVSVSAAVAAESAANQPDDPPGHSASWEILLGSATTGAGFNILRL